MGYKLSEGEKMKQNRSSVVMKLGLFTLYIAETVMNAEPFCRLPPVVTPITKYFVFYTNLSYH